MEPRAIAIPTGITVRFYGTNAVQGLPLSLFARLVAENLAVNNGAEHDAREAHSLALGPPLGGQLLLGARFRCHLRIDFVQGGSTPVPALRLRCWACWLR